ncbi:MAG: hypothetical protein F4Y80_10575 [Caldilineaceae bacterium SB0665_bin_21]|nr:hypothetical protein [Caldilineaceae bacterium SB0665_bin_21]MYC63596.1 hypothetical protein [Caldilineaceae bacterium SB0661_bin_34]
MSIEFQILPVTPDQPHELFGRFAEVLGNTSICDAEVRAAFAYATYSGVDEFLTIIATAQNWQAVRKRILVGIHNAITEPAALERLRSLDQIEIRAFVPGRRLRKGIFAMKPVFHPKVIALNANHMLMAIQAGSSNLSAAAIGRPTANYEMGMYIGTSGSRELDSDSRFAAWWTKLWDASRIVDKRFILHYAQLRQQVLEQNPIVRATVETPDTIVSARYFFLEVGAGSGPPGRRHQVEFPRELARFFGEVSYQRENIILQTAGQTWNDRPLSFKTTNYGVEIWRLGMPTQTRGGPPIAERAIRFKRTDEPRKFEFDVTDVNSDAFGDWEQSANLAGHIGATHGQRPRRYGFY